MVNTNLGIRKMTNKVTSVFLLLVAAAACMAVEAQVELEWISGEEVPTDGWSVDPGNPTSADVIDFFGYLGVQMNLPMAEERVGNPSVSIDYSSMVVQIEFDGNPTGGWSGWWSPVYGHVFGSFGPLPEGDWLLFGVALGGGGSVQFHVSPVSVIAPNGGEFLKSVSVHTIEWADSRSGDDCTGDYLLEYSSDDGATWTSIGSGPVSNACSYEWFVLPEESDECLVRVTDADDASVSDTSNDLFSIGACACLGDMNGDGWISPTDISVIISIVINTPWGIWGEYWIGPPYAKPCADLNEDGWNSPMDISAVVSMILPYESSCYWVECPE